METRIRSKAKAIHVVKAANIASGIDTRIKEGGTRM
jgi:hypothetical protein